METVTLDAAKEDLERLVARAAAGEEIVIRSEGRPPVRMTVMSEAVPKPWVPGTPRVLGQFPEWRMLPGFDDPLDPEEQAAFEGNGRLWPDER